ncbi:MAG: Glutamate transport membrane-spanning protein, partial [uncultured Chloroflexi bacterium]
AASHTPCPGGRGGRRGGAAVWGGGRCQSAVPAAGVVGDGASGGALAVTGAGAGAGLRGAARGAAAAGAGPGHGVRGVLPQYAAAGPDVLLVLWVAVADRGDAARLPGRVPGAGHLHRRIRRGGGSRRHSGGVGGAPSGGALAGHDLSADHALCGVAAGSGHHGAAAGQRDDCTDEEHQRRQCHRGAGHHVQRQHPELAHVCDVRDLHRGGGGLPGADSAAECGGEPAGAPLHAVQRV